MEQVDSASLDLEYYFYAVIARTFIQTVLLNEHQLGF